MPSPTFTNLTAGGGSSATSFTTASVTPAANRLILVTVHAYVSTGSAAPAAPTVTGNGITYSLLHTQDVDTAGSDRATMFVFIGMSAAPSTGGVTISFAASMTRCVWVVNQSDANVVTTGTNGADAVLQHVGTTFASVSSASQSYTQQLPGTSTMYAVFAHQTNVATTPRASWTEVSDAFPATLASLESQYFTGSDTAASATWGTAARTGVVVLEIASPSAVSGDLAVTQADDISSASGTVTTTGGGGVTASVVGVTRTPSDGTDATGASLALTIPSGTAIDDYAVLIIELWDSTATNPALTYPGGFTQIVNYVSTTDGFQKLKIAIKPLTAADSGTYSVSGFASHFRQGHVAILRGIDLTTALDVAVNLAQNSTGTALPANSITTVTNGCLLLHAIANENTCTGLPATGYAEQADSNYTKTNTKLQTTAGTDSISGGSFSASTLKLGALIAFRPAAGGSITGTAAVTQASNTSAATGQLGYSGASAAAQVANTSSATGTVVNPVTGTVAASEANNASSANGQLGYSGTSARTQANQTASAAGKLGYSGAAAVTQVGNTASASGSFTGVGISGNAAVTEAADTASATGQLGYSGTGTSIQANQASTAAGKLGYTGNSSAAQASQASTAVGQLGYSGTSATSQAAQTASASGTFTSAGSFSGTAAVTQANQTASAAGKLGYSGTATPAQANSTSAASGAVVNPITGTASPTQAGQFSIANGILRYTGTAAASQGSSAAAIQGIFFIPVTGTLAEVQANQTANVSGSALGATVERPFTGNTSRPSGATTPRPFAGVTERP